MFDLPKYGDGVCLTRLAALLDTLAVDRAQFTRISVVVTGSNGKGSTAAFCAGIGRAYGLRTGLFTSPHLIRFNERFQVDGADIADSDLARLASRVTTAISTLTQQHGERYGNFEALFALACLYFQESHCDFAVFEAGIGGRYDPVRLVGALTTAVTSVDYEHTELLGNSLELIAADKSDACAECGTIVYGENCRNLRPYLTEHNRPRGVTGLFVRDEIGIGGESASPSGQRFDFAFAGPDLHDLKTGLIGAFQINNAAIAATLFLLWSQQTRPQAAPSAIESAVRGGLREVRWPGRLETIGREPLTVIDVGHTPDAIRQSLAGLGAVYGTEHWILVTGVSIDKNASEIVDALAPSFDAIICTSAHHKGGDAAAIAAAAHKAHPKANVHIAATIEDAVRLSQSLAKSQNQRIYVAGGLFLAIEYAVVAKGGRAEELNFF